MNRNLLIAIPIVVAVLLVIVVVSGTAYIIDESEQVVITQFGRIVGEPITEPGLHFKIPFIQEANYFDKRLLDWEGDQTESKTLGRKFILVEVYGRWRINDPKLFLQTVSGRVDIAQSRLDAVIDPIVRDVIARYELKELVRSDTEKPIIEKIFKGSQAARDARSDEEEQADELNQNLLTQDEDQYQELESRIEYGRDQIIREIFESARDQVARFGIVLADVRIKRINYRPDVRREVYNRMIAERRREEALYLSQGEQQAAEITGRKERELQLIRSQAQEAVLKILGEGEAQAIETYARAYQKDAGFYRFYKSLETLRRTVSEETWLLLSTDAELYRILKNSGSVR